MKQSRTLNNKEGYVLKKITVNDLEFTTKREILLDALDDFGFEIPRLCKHPSLPPLGNCRLCLVEANGKIVTSCNTPITDGMKIRTNTSEVIGRRKSNLKLILANHYVECLSCFRNETCELQAISSKYPINETFE
jgi:NADH dehydrogenase/NADH:ubiquinone oxidoreductase subunit G